MLSPDFHSYHCDPTISVIKRMYLASNDEQHNSMLTNITPNGEGSETPSVLYEYHGPGMEIQEQEDQQGKKRDLSSSTSSRSVSFADPPLQDVVFFDKRAYVALDDSLQNRSRRKTVRATQGYKENNYICNKALLPSCSLSPKKEKDAKKKMKSKQQIYEEFDLEVARIRKSLEEEKLIKQKKSQDTQEFLVESCIPELRQQLSEIRVRLAKSKAKKIADKKKNHRSRR
mmetsp:Transcript_15789/g.24569  ORF Transcript_15789/g.24569 Transcript_15789/m.24569 type:complete len:229 (+) Transcript_15789:130-816(+)|eukprot:CAMPEP_0195289862 /NCGR_PEP_ID=MMETSP0707-20130614/5964_1 /TAXON_ID=33640 /ORGANISM="Asterionellopsis glacialis, Strain CCMP134" /LENGTH=228 /DNA_ID=CAMNT_0040349913 /DNA_START=62 /DNA_END=748 /DNA_ORIENTATION=-